VAGIARISREAIRQIQRAGGIRWQATKIWKASTHTGKMHIDAWQGEMIAAYKR
jgi:hypothetical protein